MNWWQQLRKKWDDWCGDREMEMSIRSHLTQNGYFGHTAKFEAVRLVAVQRPGWLQIFRFEVTARVNPASSSTAGTDSSSAGTDNMIANAEHSEHDHGPDPEAEYHRLYGLVREDHRQNRSNVRVFQSESQRLELFQRWSDGLICLRGAKGLANS
ncbi:hypothetical protein [Rhodopirellula sallentina]|uniref:Uncharacterized protein n=1 Tax=Rhodopirellula sallentina SM41 TaxID=1263870 RepID=M5U749_9BACT|nr:hypothetical protein [Rhodopirellula sallentina]EMI57307.1 hypothetical protein RSSM_01148 [Rhodopirellula sallentina SM41]